MPLAMLYLIACDVAIKVNQYLIFILIACEQLERDDNKDSASLGRMIKNMMTKMVTEMVTIMSMMIMMNDDCYLRRTSLGGTPSYFVNSCNCRRFNWKWSDQFFALGFYNQSNS